MAVSASFVEFVLEQLASLRDVWSKRMFGGVGLYRGETFFAVIDNDALFFKVDETTAARYRARKMPAFAPIPGKPPMRTYFQVPAAILEDADALAEWAREAVAVGRRGLVTSRGPEPRPRRSRMKARGVTATKTAGGR